MTHRHVDLLYFALFLAVFVFGVLAATREPDDLASVELPALDPPELEIEAPFVFPYTYVKFKRPAAPRLNLAVSMESVLVQVRSALLETSAPVEVGASEQLAAVLD